MPPKKLSKAEKDRLKQEAERKAREEEERRLKEEEEERRKEEEERRQREEEEKKHKAIEQARFDEENREMILIKDRIQGTIVEWKKKTMEESEVILNHCNYTHVVCLLYKWRHYTSCDKLPHVGDIKSLNTFFSLYNDDGKTVDVESSFDRIQVLFKAS
jgi:flagellar biosynthesis GTPase FlhF